VGGREDYVASQRVEFRVRTKADDRLEEILGDLPPKKWTGLSCF
jgi:hypothetical protein